MQVTFKIQYNTVWGESLCLVARDVKYPMSWGDGGVWSVTLPRCAKADLADYSYVVMRDGLIWRTEWDHHHRSVDSLTTASASGGAASDASGGQTGFDGGQQHGVPTADASAGQQPAFRIGTSAGQAFANAGVIVQDAWIDCPIQGCPFPRKHSAGIFDRPGYKGAGTVIPVFSLRTEGDFGIGEFRDLRPLVDWAAATGQSVIQLLPVNDTTRKGEWGDSYPYSPISSFALHPLYIHLPDVGVKETPSYRRTKQELNDLVELDYPRVFKEKMALLRKAFKANGAATLGTREYKRFCRDNTLWLDEYAEFCSRRDGDNADFWRWVQYHLDKQFSEEVAYAHSKGVYFKGDLPIGVSRDSAEAYWHPELFNLDSNAGAPPDFFSSEGQNWGFPTYNWDAMAEDDYAWWKARLRKMSQYFSAFRIDHILGFFRIWEIPVECKSGLGGHFNPALPYTSEELSRMQLPTEGLFLPDPRHKDCWQPMITPTGKDALEWWQRERYEALYNDFFYHRHNDFWKRNAERKLPELLSATGMLACGEDLGMVPDCVPEVMDHEKILSLEMMNVDKHRPWPYLSVCATSSHDMETLRMQSQGDRTPEECERIICEHLDSASMLAIFPLQDWLSLDGRLRRPDFQSERINQPADPDNHWRFRIHLDLERLPLEGGFLAKVGDLIRRYGRSR